MTGFLTVFLTDSVTDFIGVELIAVHRKHPTHDEGYEFLSLENRGT